jgi:hypothetical protein
MNKEVSDLTSTKPKEVVRDKQDAQSLRYLLQPIQRLVDVANMIGLYRINKSSRLAAVDGLQECAVQEHILYINLMN